MNKYNSAIEDLIDKAKDSVRQKYQHLTYHNINHTIHVIEAVDKIAKKALTSNKINEREFHLIRLAAAYHDIEYSLAPVKNEQASVDILLNAMSQYSVFTKKDKQIVTSCILATIVKDFSTLEQSADKDDYPAMTVADADLSSFGSTYKTYSMLAWDYFAEIHPGKNTESNEYKKYLNLQKQLLSNHKFYTPEARELYPHQPANLLKLLI